MSQPIVKSITASDLRNCPRIQADIAIIHLDEVEKLIGYSNTMMESINKSAQKLLDMGAKNVLIQNAYFTTDQFDHDYWTDGEDSFWLVSIKKNDVNFSDENNVLSMAVTAALALNFSVKDALVIARMYLNQVRRLGVVSELTSATWPEHEIDLPFLVKNPIKNFPKSFPKISDLGIYPIVDSAEWVARLLQCGVKTIQLRIKNKDQISLENEIKTAVNYAKKYDAKLFINDFWQLAIQYDAYGVHLGQEDLEEANLQAIREANLALGISTYCYHEVARAHVYAPSYIACGPIYPTASKELAYPSQGIENLARWRRTLKYPLVAIGGISQQRILDVLNTGVDGIAMISAITQTSDPEKTTRDMLNLVNRLS